MITMQSYLLYQPYCVYGGPTLVGNPQIDLSGSSLPGLPWQQSSQEVCSIQGW
ncbi:hypothetical protein BDZ94DRAFT_1327695 [Collybia nuda]|uniref:Uncharacterized protein n=1 Tax=Collybia nuda TaxID=64659 RepID=A0A9P5XPA3_9AGAR|nr:hypothetical protein BDZ94DRAFT_1327695 [Collybia nuda]